MAPVRAAGPARARLFVAVELPAELRASLEARAHALRDAQPGLRAIRADAIHLTLKFLGPVERDGIDAVSLRIGEVAARRSPFDCELVGLGAFPRAESAQVVWAGARPSASFAELASRLDDALAPLGFALETRRFHPHVTIARPRGRGPTPGLGDALRCARDERLGAFAVCAVTLFESFLEREGARYVAVARRALGAPLA